MAIYLVRHAPAQVSGVCYGQSDVPVAPPASEAAKTVLASIDALAPGATLPFTSIVTSPTTRTRTLAEALARALEGIPLRVEPRLRELDFGSWEGRTWADLEKDEGPALSAWMRAWQEARVPGGEGAPDLVRRVREVWGELSESGESYLLVTHAGPIRVLRSLTQSRTLSDVWAERVEHLTVERLRESS
ncbi:Alpha-ribazole-5'-phosphate phosphatase [Labilithrix luteola]|uniref:Alpha-ribazole-5'-phosphate phosphatase n=2 Tax=Labilithrix luteola TaxID=1391654 RepID=A0A0K1Q9Z6_9BACT|nr:Alpha-ribazole-5'-phosphate phosphatase [Labilithrix luteola]